LKAWPLKGLEELSYENAVIFIRCSILKVAVTTVKNLHPSTYLSGIYATGTGRNDSDFLLKAGLGDAT